MLRVGQIVLCGGFVVSVGISHMSNIGNGTSVFYFMRQ